MRNNLLCVNACFLLNAGSLFEEYCALAEYQGDDPSQISFTSGQIVLVLDKDNSGVYALYVYSGTSEQGLLGLIVLSLVERLSLSWR